MNELTHAQNLPARSPVKRSARTTLHRTAGLGLVLSVIAAGFGVAPAQAATPEPSSPGAAATAQCHGYLLTAGPKLKAKAGFRTEFIGTIKLNGQCGVCIDYGLQGPDGKWGTGSITSIKDKDVRKRVMWLANAYGPAADVSDRQAAALKSAINLLVSPAFKYDWTHSYVGQLKAKDAGVAPRVAEMLEASKAAGDVNTTAVLVTKPKPGGTGVVEMTTKGNGRPIAGADVTWTPVGVKVVSSSKQTRSDGTAILRFTWTGAKALSIKGVVQSPDSTRAVFSTPNSIRKQHLVRGSYSVKSAATVRYDSVLGASITQDCDTTCDGKPPVTMTAQAGGAATTWQAIVAGKVVATLNVTAGRSGSKTFTGTDGAHITFRYRIGKGAWRTSKTAFDVICPPIPTVVPVKTCICKGPVTGGYIYTGGGGSRFDVVRLTINGVVQEKSLTGSETATLTGPLASGAHVTATYETFADAGHTKRLSGGKLDGFVQD